MKATQLLGDRTRAWQFQTPRVIAFSAWLGTSQSQAWGPPHLAGDPGGTGAVRGVLEQGAGLYTTRGPKTLMGLLTFRETRARLSMAPALDTLVGTVLPQEPMSQ